MNNATKIIDGKRYGLVQSHWYKRGAEESARVYRQRGYNARIIKEKNKQNRDCYNVYIRKDR